jgi:hypothetical protein
MAQSGHPGRVVECPFSGVKRTFRRHTPMSAYDPKRTLPSAGLATSCLGQLPTIGLLSEPGNSQVNARHHCEYGSDPHPSWPKPTRPASREQRSDRADHQRAECGRGSPAVPIQLGGEEIQNGIGDIAGTVQARKNDAERRIDGKKRKPLGPRPRIDERERRAIGQDEATKCGSGRHVPNPTILLTT